MARAVASHPEKLSSQNLVVGIDIGSNCGFAVLDGSTRVASGTWRLWVDKDRRDKNPEWWRWDRLEIELGELLAQLREDYDLSELTVVFEDVRRHPGGGTKAAHVYGGLRAVLELFCGREDIPCEGIAVGTWKRVATGKGHATKLEYVKAMNSRFRLRMTVAKREDEAAALGVAEAFRLLREEGKR